MARSALWSTSDPPNSTSYGSITGRLWVWQHTPLLPLTNLTYYRLRMPCILLIGIWTSCRLYILHHTMKPQYMFRCFFILISRFFVYSPISCGELSFIDFSLCEL